MEDAAGDAGEVAPPAGTWDDPYPPYTPVVIDGWEVAIDDALLMTEGPDPVNMPGSGAPDDGTVHVVVHVQATRTGDDPARIPTMGEGFTISLTNNGTEVGQNVAIPIDDEIPSGDVGPGSTVEGWMLARAHVPEGEVDGSAVTVAPFVANPETYYVELPN